MQHEVPYVVGCGWLALAGATVDQSTTNYNGNSIRAVDGSTNGAFADGSCTHTAETGTDPWWRVIAELIIKGTNE